MRDEISKSRRFRAWSLQRLRQSRVALAALVSQAVVALSTLLTGVVAARLLSLDERGEAASVVVSIALIVYILDVGTTPAFVYFAAKHSVRPAFLKNVPLTAIIVLTFLGIVAFGYAQDSLAYAVLGAIYGFANVAARWCNALCYGAGLAIAVSRNRLIQSSVFLLLLLVVLQTVDSALGYLACFAISWAVQALAAMRLLRRRATGLQRTSALTNGRRFWRFALLSYVSGQSALDAWRLDIVLAGFIFGQRDVAMLAIAVAYGSQVRQVAAAVSPLVQVSAARGQSAQQLRISLVKFGGLTVLAACLMGFLAPTAVPLLFGSDYEDAVVIAVLYCASALPSGLRAMMSDALRGAGHPGKAAAVEGLVLTVFIVGAAFASTPVQLVLAVFLAQLLGFMVSMTTTHFALKANVGQACA